MLALFPDRSETIEGAADDLRNGRTTCAELLERCLKRVDEWEPRVNAWVVLDRDRARAQARALDDDRERSFYLGPLRGIPVGIKDIIDVEGLPTAAGYAPWTHRVAEADAPLVARLRGAGAVILGKTVTTQFAWVDPPLTGNPWDHGRTPGGSSSGSAAAVATGMCLAALGSQTGGSIVRPASFCGVCGLKPAYGRLPVQGVVPLSESLDHPGPIARTVGDLFQVYKAIAGLPPGKPPQPADAAPVLVRLGRFFHDRMEGPTRSAFDAAVAALRDAGATVVDRDEPGFDEVPRRHRLVMAAEAAAEHRKRLALTPGDYGPQVKALVAEGLNAPAVDYIEGRKAQRRASALADRVLGESGAVAFVVPATVGPAPDRSTTGDSIFNAVWSFTGSPVISLPFGLSPDGLPLALQLVGRSPWPEPAPDPVGGLAPAALWCERVFRTGDRSRKV